MQIAFYQNNFPGAGGSMHDIMDRLNGLRMTSLNNNAVTQFIAEKFPDFDLLILYNATLAREHGRLFT